MAVRRQEPKITAGFSPKTSKNVAYVIDQIYRARVPVIDQISIADIDYEVHHEVVQWHGLILTSG